MDGYDYKDVYQAYLDDGYSEDEAAEKARELCSKMYTYDRHAQQTEQYIRDMKNEILWRTRPDSGKRGELGLVGSRRKHSGVDKSVERQDERRERRHKLRLKNP